MKVKNLEVGIKIGNRERKFTNLILNSYLDLFANSLLDFKEKNLPYCFVNFTKSNSDISENSVEMEYDTILEADFSQNVEILTDKNIINKYYYTLPLAGFEAIESFQGQAIKQIGFGNYDYDLEDYVLYAYLDISKYNIVIQENQPIIINRIDKIVSDMNFWSNSTLIKSPYHLTGRGLLETGGYDYVRVLPKLYSVGFGVLPYLYIDEYLAEDLNIEKTGTGEITITGINSNFAKNDLFPRPDLYPSPNLFPRESTANLLIYKFKMYREVYEDPMLPPNLEDTGLFYVQYTELDRFGIIKNLKIKYERG